jgi:hypothetical protein
MSYMARLRVDLQERVHEKHFQSITNKYSCRKPLAFSETMNYTVITKEISIYIIIFNFGCISKYFM